MSRPSQKKKIFSQALKSLNLHQNWIFLSKCNYFSHCLHFSAYTTWFMSKTEWKLLLAAASIGNSEGAAGICRRALRLRAEGSVRPSECGLPLAPLITTMRQRKRTDESSQADAKNGKQSSVLVFFLDFLRVKFILEMLHCTATLECNNLRF